MTFLAGQKATAAALNEATDPPLLYAFQSITQNLLHGTWTAITMDQETKDTINGHSTVTSTSRYTPNVAGTYEFEGQLAIAASTTGDRGVQFRKNGATVDGLVYGAQPAMNGTGAFAGIARCGGIVFLNGSTDYVELWGFQDSGVTLATFYSVGFTTSYMKIKRIGS